MEQSKNKTLVNPLEKYRTEGYPEQTQPAPGVQQKMNPVPDCGEKSYIGSGKLKGRKALVTGGDSGIGRAVVIAYAREGAAVAINYMKEEQQDAESLKTLLEEEGHRIVLIPGDVSIEQECKDIIRQANSELGGLDLLVLNAGKQVAVESIEDLPTDQLRKTFETNIFAMFWMVKAALAHLPAGSSIITTSSIQSYQPSPQLLDYAATKSAIVSFTMGLAQQLAPKGIRVNSVAPGPIWTALQVSGGQMPDKIPDFGQSTLLKRSGQPAELAGAYVYLASEDASYTTGDVIRVTGGMISY